MDNNNSGGSTNFGFNKPKTADANQSNLPVEETDVQTVTETSNKDEYTDGDQSYTHISSVTISLIASYSLYRKANDKSLPKRSDYIGSSVVAGRILSSNQKEVEAYFPALIGLAPNNVEFITRVKQYLNNIRVPIDGLGKTFNTSFTYNKKSSYYDIVREEEAIEEEYLKANKTSLSNLKAALKVKIEKINVLESRKHLLGTPVNLEHYLMYRHCLLYPDVAKDTALINSDKSIRFYFKDDAKEAEKLLKFRGEINKAKANYVKILGDNAFFDAVYIQYCVVNNLPVVASLAENRVDREIRLDKFSSENPIKFNKIVNNKDSQLIGTIEKLIAHGELHRSQFNQNISSADGLFIGANMNEAVNWFKNPDNNSTVDVYYNKLKNI